MVYKQGEIYLTNLDPTTGREQQGTRPVVIISWNAFNTNNQIVIVAPITSKIKKFFGSILLTPTKKNWLTIASEVLLSHTRAISTARCKKRLGTVTSTEIVQMHYKLHLLLTTQ
jgi:mRNA interferase MazF